MQGWAIGATWLDYDRDGCVDLFVARYVKFDPSYRAYYAPDNYPGPLDYEGDTNLLFHNTCKGSFTDVSEKSGIAAFTGRAMSSTAADFDGDGYPDIFVANDKTENFLFRNHGDGRFEEIALEAGAAFGQNGESVSAMGPVFFDLDNDGLPDLWVTDSKYNRLLKNNGKLPFTDVTERAGISQLAAQYTSWGTGAYDFDNDGLKDILIFHGGLIHLIPQEHSLFKNLGGGKFQDVSTGGGPFFETKTVGRGTCFADYDNDGKVDAFLVNLGGPGQLLHNVSPAAGHWLMIRLIGVKSNRSQGFRGNDLEDLVSYVKSIPLRPNRYRLPNGELTLAQQRGKAIFEMSRKKDGTPIPEMARCSGCHSGKHYTNQLVADTGTSKSTDHAREWDVPQLTNIALSAPYLHDGSAQTLEELWTVFNPKDQHGVTNDLTKDELNDLIEYLKTL